jgi:hypothetical protein
MVNVFLPYKKANRKPYGDFTVGQRRPSAVKVDEHYEMESMRDGPACPRCKQTRQARFWNGWHWCCCGQRSNTIDC